MSLTEFNQIRVKVGIVVVGAWFGFSFWFSAEGCPGRMGDII